MKKKKTNKRAQTKKKQSLASKIVYAVIFLVGLGILSFPFVSQFQYWRAANVEINTFKEEVLEMDRTEIDRRMKLAHAYNDGLSTDTLHDPYSEEEIQEGVAEYARMLEVNELIGTVSIPEISVELPIYAGTSDEVLHKGIGHLEGTSLPVGGNSTHSVITGHRGLPDKRLFTDLPELEIGDKFYVQNVGETIAYQVDHIDVIEPTDFSQLLVEPGHDYMTLLTCTPYMINSHRLIVRGHRIDYDEAVQEREIRENNASNLYRILFYITLGILVLLLLYLLFKRLRRNKKNKRNKIDKN